jgi:putative transposase
MKRGRFTQSQIVSILKEADAGTKVKEICRRHSISDAMYYNWKAKYGGMRPTSECRYKWGRLPGQVRTAESDEQLGGKRKAPAAYATGAFLII